MLNAAEIVSIAAAQEYFQVDAKLFRQWMREAGVKSFTLSQGDRTQYLHREDVVRISNLPGLANKVHLHLEIVDTLVAEYGQFDNYAKMLLRRAHANAGANLLSGVHVLLVALRQPGIQQALYSATTLRDLYRTFQLPNLEAALLAWGNTMASHSVQDVPYTRGLASALEKAREAAIRENQREIGWYHLLRGILAADSDVYAVVSSVQQGSPLYTSHNSAPFDSQFSISAINSHTYSPVRREPTNTLRYRTRHHMDMKHLIEQLAERRPGQVVLVRGLHGSPRERLVQVLADTLTNPSQEIMNTSLAHVRFVLSQDVGQLHAAGLSNPEDAIMALRHSMKQAENLQAVLVLERGELLANDEEVNDHLLGTLVDSGNVPIVISFEDRDERAAKVPVSLRFLNYRLVVMDPYTTENTRNAIPDYYAALWQEHGVHWNSDALDTFYLVEPAIFVESNGVMKRKALPYSAADLAQEAVEMIRDEVSSGGYVRSCALRAHQRVKGLLRDPSEGKRLFTEVEGLGRIIDEQEQDQELVREAKPLYDEWRERCKALLALPERMQQLAERPSLEQVNGDLYVVNDNHVIAELLGESTYHIRLVEAFERAVDACDPQLLDMVLSE